MNQYENTAYKPFIRFTDQGESFTLGWECGQIFYALLKEGGYEGLAHLKNVEQIQLMARKMKFFVEITPIPEMEEEWIDIKISKPVVHLNKKVSK